MSASLTDPREPWRIAVAAAEASADAQLHYADEVAKLRSELAESVAPSDTMRELHDRVIELEQTLRNQPAQPAAVAMEPGVPVIVAWLLFLIILWLAAVSGVLAGRIGFEREASQGAATMSKGGFLP